MTYPLRFEGSKGLWEEQFSRTTLFAGESDLQDCLVGLKKKRKATAEAKAPKIVAVETRVNSREFMIVEVKGETLHHTPQLPHSSLERERGEREKGNTKSGGRYLPNQRA